MNGKRGGKSHEIDVLFAVPDTGIGVAWDYNAGCGLDADVTQFQPGIATPKQKKLSVVTRFSRRRCLSNLRASSKDDIANFTAQLASLSSLDRKKAIKNSPGVSPKCRSPRNIRLKTPVPSPRRSVSTPSPARKNSFQSLLNDSIDNDVMIRCSQAVEEACMKGEPKTPLVSRPDGRTLSLKRSGREVGSPLSRKRLMNRTSPVSRKLDSPQAKPSGKPEAENLVTRLPDDPVGPPVGLPAGPKPDVVKSADKRNNNNIEANFGLCEDDDDIFMNLLDECSKSDESLQWKSSSIVKDKSSSSGTSGGNQEDQRRRAKLSTVSTSSSSGKWVVNTDSKGAESTTSAAHDNSRGIYQSKSGDKRTAAEGDSRVADQKLKGLEPLDDSETDFDLSQDLLNLLDGKISDLNDIPVPSNSVVTKQSVPLAGISKRTLQPNQTSDPTTKPVAAKTGMSEAQPSAKPNAVPVTRPPVVQTSRLSVQQNARSTSASTVANTKCPEAPVQTRNQTVKPSLSSIQEPASRKCTPEEIERKRQEALKRSSAPFKETIRKCTPEEIERKRQEALKLSSAHCKEPVFRKCTPEEIERKRQEAMQRLRAKTARR